MKIHFQFYAGRDYLPLICRKATNYLIDKDKKIIFDFFLIFKAQNPKNISKIGKKSKQGGQIKINH